MNVTATIIFGVVVGVNAAATVTAVMARRAHLAATRLLNAALAPCERCGHPGGFHWRGAGVCTVAVEDFMWRCNCDEFVAPRPPVTTQGGHR